MEGEKVDMPMIEKRQCFRGFAPPQWRSMVKCCIT
jgi:hypothetical protein